MIVLVFRYHCSGEPMAELQQRDGVTGMVTLSRASMQRKAMLYVSIRKNVSLAHGSLG